MYRRSPHRISTALQAAQKRLYLRAISIMKVPKPVGITHIAATLWCNKVILTANKVKKQISKTKATMKERIQLLELGKG